MRRLFLLLLLTACTPSEQKTNNLINSASPYLREHADNPVNWYEWGDEAINLSKQQNKPMIVSIGYSACHWCHVMEEETFMDEDVAKIMNENFICVKVDREERPDVDAEYVRAAESLQGPVGWPLNAFASTDGFAFHVATYLPKEQWMKLLQAVSENWSKNKTGIEDRAKLMKSARDVPEYPAPDDPIKLELQAFLYNVPGGFADLDFNNGGLQGKMKFPMPTVAEFLLQYADLTADKTSRQWVITTLNAMMNGGIYDYLGGGFSRYATDSLWRVPHFEKMLYDNGQLVSLYSHALRVTGNKDYERVVRETLDFIEREMTSPEGAFYSSINADSEGEEGKFYKWSENQIGNDALEYFAIYDGVLNLRKSPPADIKTRLLETRNKRTHPSIDQKIITSWNAMMITGFVDAFTVTGDQHYLDVALKAASYLDSKVTDDKRVLRIIFEGKTGREGLLDDYAWLAKAYIHLYQATFDITWLNKAKSIADLAIHKFAKEESPLFLYSANGQTEFFDNVIPSSNSVFADVLLSLGEYYQNEDYTRIATTAIETAVSPVPSYPMYISNWARLAQQIDFGPYQIAIVGDRATDFSMQLQRMSLPPAIFIGGSSENLPLLENKLVKNKTMIYVCKNRTCKLPVDDPQKALQQIYR